MPSLPDVNSLDAFLRKAVHELYINDFFLIEENAHELTISGALVGYLRDLKSAPYELHIDPEYNRMTNNDGDQVIKKLNGLVRQNRTGRVRPDIVVHRREDGKHNGMIVEVKIQANQVDPKRSLEVEKLQIFTSSRRDGGLEYNVGYLLDIGPDDTKLSMFIRGNLMKQCTLNSPVPPTVLRPLTFG